MTTNPLRLGRARPRDDAGVALILVLGVMTALTLVAVAAVTFATTGIGQARTSQDRSGAMAAAQAGADDYLARLNVCDSYWTGTPCLPGETNPALGGWQTIPGTDPQTPAQFTYELTTKPPETPGELTLRVTGRVGPETRPITVRLRKQGFLNYIYYTDRETADPLNILNQYPALYFSGITYFDFNEDGTAEPVREVRYAAVTPASASRCARYWYTTPSQPTERGGFVQTVTYQESVGGKWQDRTTDIVRSCDIAFDSADKITGPLHTNDAILLRDGAWFADETVRSAWPDCPDPTPATFACFRPEPATATPAAAGFRPGAAPPMVMPDSNAKLRAWADSAGGGQGCVYRGPTGITFNASGTLTVVSPGTASATQGTSVCVGTGIAGPSNGVLWVDKDPLATCDTKVLNTFPEDGDLTTYSCRTGTAFVSGTYQGRFTVGTADDIVLVGDTPRSDAQSVLGLVATTNVSVYHPVVCTYTPSGSDSCFAKSSLWPSYSQVTTYKDALADGVFRVDAAILSVQHTFTVQNFDVGKVVQFSPWTTERLGTLRVDGGIYQRNRGEVGTTGGNPSGYLKDYRYEPGLVSLPPPYFLDPVSSAWGVAEFREE